MPVRFTLDIPVELHSKLLKRAQREGITVNNLILRSVQSSLKVAAKPRRRRNPPIIESETPGSLHLDSAKIYEIIDFP
jgi:hypothetical protein